jgi:hypothetical protein
MASAFEPGDRVELQGLVSRPEVCCLDTMQLASRRLPLLLLLPACLPACRAADTSCLKILQLNDLAGTVAGPLVDGRHKVSLDAGGKLVNAKAASLRPRPPPPSSGAGSTTEPAAVHDAHCREDEGRLFHLVLDLTRFYANERVRLCQLDGPEDLGKLRSSPEGMDVLRKLAGAAWTYWMPLPGHDFPGVRARVLQQATQTLAKLAEIEAPPEVPPSLFPYTASAQELMLAEMQKGDAAHWGDSTRRITGSFFAIEQRDGGTVMLRHATPAMTNAAGAVVPARENELYLVAGIAEGIGQMLARRQGLALPAGPLELTLLPYRGRYIYDGLVAGRIRTVPTALLEELVADVRTLEESGQLRVTPPPPTDEQIARLLQQERRARFEAAAEEEDEPAEPLDAETARLVDELGQLAAIPEPSDEDQRAGLDPTMWCEQTDGREHTEREREREFQVFKV